jgi:hypothetical protein
MQVARFIVNPAWRLTPEEIGLRAAALLPAGPPTPGVLIQRLSA